jgi:hypothetical protein
VRAALASAERGPLVSSIVIVSALAAFAAAIVSGAPALRIAPGIAIVIFLTLTYRALLTWSTLVGVLLVAVLFIPMQRFVLPASLPFELDPYRVLVAFIITAWAACLLVDPNVRLRSSGLGPPMVVLVGAIVASIIGNPGRVSAMGPEVIKALSFFMSFVLVFYVIVSVARTRAHLDLFVRILVGGGSLVALAGVIESRTQKNVFNWLPHVMPFLKPGTLNTIVGDDRGYRAYASAQHPIALGALLVVLLPLAIYLIKKTGQRRWWLAGMLLAFGALATMSRTGVLMLIAVVFVYLWLRPKETRRLWPLLLPCLLAIHLVLPGTIGTLKEAFFPKGGLIADQATNVGSRGQGRVADIGPSLHEFAQRPLFGEGFGTRQTDRGPKSAQILDDQWLGSLLETGLLGTGAWLWLFVRTIRRQARRAKEDSSAEGWLSVGLAASTLAFVVGMLTFDAFSFSQVTVVMFILMALASIHLSHGTARTIGPRAAAE